MQPGTGAAVETLLVEEPGGTVAYQAIAGGPAAVGRSNPAKGAMEVDTALAGYGLNGALAYGDDRAWLSRAGACRQVRLVLSEPEAVFAAGFLAQYGERLASGVGSKGRHAAELVDVRVLGVPVEVGAVRGLLECLRSAEQGDSKEAVTAGALRRRVGEALGACPERKVPGKLRQVMASAAAEFARP